MGACRSGEDLRARTASRPAAFPDLSPPRRRPATASSDLARAIPSSRDKRVQLDPHDTTLRAALLQRIEESRPPTPSARAAARIVSLLVRRSSGGANEVVAESKRALVDPVEVVDREQRLLQLRRTPGWRPRRCAQTPTGSRSAPRRGAPPAPPRARAPRPGLSAVPRGCKRYRTLWLIAGYAEPVPGTSTCVEASSSSLLLPLPGSPTTRAATGAVASCPAAAISRIASQLGCPADELRHALLNPEILNELDVVESGLRSGDRHEDRVFVGGRAKRARGFRRDAHGGPATRARRCLRRASPAPVPKRVGRPPPEPCDDDHEASASPRQNVQR